MSFSVISEKNTTIFSVLEPQNCSYNDGENSVTELTQVGDGNIKEKDGDPKHLTHPVPSTIK